MLKKIRFLFLLILITTIVIISNNSISNIPPLGKFLNPYSGFWQNGEINQNKVFNNIDLKNIKDEVIIQFDSMLIPHIYANNDEDLFYTQGYVTALHRLWQMEFQIMAISGRLSEIFGNRALKNDRTQRRKGMVYAAKKTLEKSFEDENTIKLLKAYVNGVNDYISSLSLKNYPIEYKMLNYKPEKWTLLKTFLLMESMSDMLSRGNMDIEDTYLLKILGIKNYNLLFPEYHDEVKPIIPDDIKFNFEPLKTKDYDRKISYKFPDETILNPDRDNGSNNFAISSQKSKDGSTYLASQPDLSLNLPSIWYISHLNSPSFNTMGATLPGAPGVIIGFNDDIAWGETNATRDVVDWYSVIFRNKDRKEYKFGDRWLKTEKIIEEFNVKGEGIFYDTVVYTHLGPIVYDNNFSSNKEKINLAMRWIAHDESVEYKTFLLLNKAKNIDDIDRALEFFYGPSQNFAYATRDGDIGLTIAGKFPLKSKEQGKFILDGSNPEHEWQGFIPYDHRLTVKNPKSGYVSSANQHPVNKLYPYYYYSHNYEMYRGRRLIERLESIDYLDIEDIKKIQNDNFSYKAYEILPFILSKVDTIRLGSEEMKYFKNIKNWDFFSNTNDENPSFFVTWWDFLYKNIWDEFDTLKYKYRKPSSFTTTKIIKNIESFQYYDNLKTSEIEGLDDIINLTFNKAVDSVNNWKKNNNKTKVSWKDYKNTTVKHLLGIESFSVENVDVGGYRNILNAASQRHGPSWRMIVKLNKNSKTEAWGIYPGGQSGNPGNINYSNGIDDWGKGKYKKLLFNKNYLDNTNRVIFEKKYQSQ